MFFTPGESKSLINEQLEKAQQHNTRFMLVYRFKLSAIDSICGIVLTTAKSFNLILIFNNGKY